MSESTHKVNIVFDARTSAAEQQTAAFLKREEAKLRQFYNSQAGSAAAAQVRRDSGLSASTPLQAVKNELIQRRLSLAASERIATQESALQTKTAKNNAKNNAIAAKNAEKQWRNYQKQAAITTAKQATLQSYQGAIQSGDYLSAIGMQGAAVALGAKGLTLGQRWKAGAQASGQGYGKYLIAGMVGGNAGLLGTALMDNWVTRGKTIGGTAGRIVSGAGRLVGSSMMIGGMTYMAGKAAIGLARKGGDLLGLNQDTMQDYMEFDKALRLATLNLKAGVASTDFGVISKKFKNAAMSLSTEFGAAGNSTDMANLFRAMSGVGGLSTGQEIIDLSRVAIKLASVSEQTSPEEAGRGIMAISNAAKGVGIKGLSFDMIAASMYKAGAMSPLMVSDLTKNAGNIAVSMAAGSSLSEALSSYMLLTTLGMSSAKAGTQLASFKVRMPATVTNKGFGAALGVSGKELSNMNAMEFITALSNTAVKEKLNTTYGLSQGANPLTAHSVLNDIGLILQDAFGLRGGQYATLLGQTLGDPDSKAALESWITGLTNSGDLLKTFNGAVDEVASSLSNQIAGAGNAIENLKFEIWGVLAPWAGRIGGTAGIAASRARIQNGNLTPSQLKTEQEKLAAMEKNLKNPQALYDEQMVLYKGTMYEPFIKMGKTVDEWVTKNFNSDTIELFVKNMGSFISTVIDGLAWFAEALMNAADIIVRMPIIGNPDYVALEDKLTGWYGSQDSAKKIIRKMSPESRKTAETIAGGMVGTEGDLQLAKIYGNKGAEQEYTRIINSENKAIANIISGTIKGNSELSKAMVSEQQKTNALLAQIAGKNWITNITDLVGGNTPKNTKSKGDAGNPIDVSQYPNNTLLPAS